MNMKNALLHILCLNSLSSFAEAVAQTEVYVPPIYSRTTPAPGDEYVTDLIKWFSSIDGRLNKKVDIRRTDPNDPTSPFGMFALDDVYGKELIMSIPRKKVLTAEAGKDAIQSALPCETAFKLIEEMEKGNSSEFSGYVNFLKHQERGVVPSTWSDAGKDLLNIVIDELPPEDATTWIEDEWYEECAGEKDEEKENIAMMLISRGWDSLMIPLYDIMNHRNGNYHNTYSDAITEKSRNVLQVRANRRIQIGEQIYTSYNMCEECDARVHDYGTPEILRDYGFVEDYPQRWIFDDVLKFEIRDNSTIEEEEETTVKRLKEPTSDELEFVWLSDVKELGLDDMEFLEFEIDRLVSMTENEFTTFKSVVPQKEFDVILQYHEALVKALTMALENLPTFKDPVDEL